ncbi:hypothetical protein D1007_51392 [Hordeum vulgare]|nr:hypothetical protein D1007_51392 [Hordeum vulgare]KAI5005040.1 hypothetical protein ZWY2020_032283 [Hordeum vulgare]KAI5005046.1 hypothetical protein ZWY2020_032289 [Hordeum vulgare]
MEYYDDFAGASEPESAWVGMKRGHGRSEGKLDAALMEKRHKCGDNSWTATAAYAPVLGTTRAYERSEDEFDLSIDKRYKCNYWEDPAYARILHLKGGSKARDAALTNLTWRYIKDIDDWLHERQAARKSTM